MSVLYRSSSLSFVSIRALKKDAAPHAATVEARNQWIHLEGQARAVQAESWAGTEDFATNPAGRVRLPEQMLGLRNVQFRQPEDARPMDRPHRGGHHRPFSDLVAAAGLCFVIFVEFESALGVIRILIDAAGGSLIPGSGAVPRSSRPYRDERVFGPSR
jgi:hypothetical protein